MPDFRALREDYRALQVRFASALAAMLAQMLLVAWAIATEFRPAVYFAGAAYFLTGAYVFVAWAYMFQAGLRLRRAKKDLGADV